MKNYSDNPTLTMERDNRTRAQIALVEIKKRNEGKEFVRVPIDRGYKEIEIEKFNRRKA